MSGSRLERITKTLRDNLLDEQEGLKWDRDHRPRLRALMNALDEFRHLLAQTAPSPWKERLVPLEEEALDLVTRTLHEYDGGKRGGFFSAHSSKEVNDKVRAVLGSLGMTRGGFLRLAAGTAAAAGLGLGTAHADEYDRWMTDAFYLQFGACRDEESAKYNLRHAWHKLEPFRTTDQEDRFPVKLLSPKAYASQEQAQEALLAMKHAPSSAGIVLMKPGHRTMWVKTVEERILERAKRLVAVPGLPFYELILAAVKRYPLRGNVKWDASLVHGLIEVESRYEPTAGSGAGAKGLMQVMPAMFNHFHHKSLLFHPPRGKGKRHTCSLIKDPEQNIDAGVCHIHYLFRKWDRGGQASVITILRYYNGGETAVRAGRLERDKENREYPEKVLNAQVNYR